MPRLATLPESTAPVALRSHGRRLENLELRRPAAPASALPSAPVIGQRHVIPHASGVWEVVWTGTVWAFVGGADLVSFTAAELTYDSATYPASPQGPSVLLPAAGTFDIYASARHRHDHTAPLFTAVSVGPTGSSHASLVAVERAPVLPNGTYTYQSWWWEEGFPLGAQLVHLWFRAPSGGGIDTHYLNRQIRVRPRILN